MFEDLTDLKQEELQMIVFQLGNEEYTIPITCIQEIIMLQSLTKVPKSPSFVEGVINLRGHIISIIDGKKRFGIDIKNDESTAQRIMILELESHTIGLIVDSVSEVVNLKIKDIEPLPVDITEENSFLKGVCKFKERLLILLDANKLLSSHEIISLENISKTVENIKKANETIKEDLTKEKSPKTQ